MKALRELVGGLVMLAIGWRLLTGDWPHLPDMTATKPEAPITGMPVSETTFVETVRHFAEAYAAGQNDMAKGATRPARKEALEGMSQQIDGDGPAWVGRVTTLSSTNAGKGVLEIDLGNNITIGTTNNEFSDSLGGHTLLDPGTPIFGAAMKLHVGQVVEFTGTLLRGDEDFYKETSLTQEGAMTSPTFEMTFQTVQAVDR